MVPPLLLKVDDKVNWDLKMCQKDSCNYVIPFHSNVLLYFKLLIVLPTQSAKGTVSLPFLWMFSMVHYISDKSVIPEVSFCLVKYVLLAFPTSNCVSVWPLHYLFYAHSKDATCIHAKTTACLSPQH